MSKQSKDFVTVNMHRGLYRYNRLPFWILSAPSIFQHNIENLLPGIKDVSIYIDNILISGSTLHEHLQILDTVLDKLQNSGLKLNIAKCYFLQDQSNILVISSTEMVCIRPLRKHERFKKYEHHKNISELRSFFSIITIDFYQTSQR